MRVRKKLVNVIIESVMFLTFPGSGIFITNWGQQIGSCFIYFGAILIFNSRIFLFETL